MSAYAGFLVSLTLYLQGSLRYTPLHAGLIFTIYACGFATASLTWTRTGAATRDRLPVLGPPTMGLALLAVGLIATRGGWPLAVTGPLLFAGGVGHACSFSPLTNGLAAAVTPAQAPDLSGLIMTASLVGQVLGLAVFVGLYLDAAPHGAARALGVTTGAIAAALVVGTACALRARADRTPPDCRLPRALQPPDCRLPRALHPPDCRLLFPRGGIRW